MQSPLQALGRALIGLGVLLVVAGAAALLASRIPHLGRLPGDIRIERPGFKLYFPLATSLLVGAALSVILALLRRR